MRPVQNPRWFVVWTNPKCEQRAMGGLVAAGYQAYLPMSAKWAKLSRPKPGEPNRVRTTNPLFPRYLFVGLDTDTPFYPIRLIDGVAGIVTNKGAPVMVPGHIVAALREAESGGAFDETIDRRTGKPRPADAMPEPGEEYRVKMAGVEFVAEVLKTDSRRRVEVLLRDINGGAPQFEGKPVTVDVAKLCAA